MTDQIRAVLVDLDHTLLNQDLSRKLVSEELDTAFSEIRGSPKPSEIYLAFSRESDRICNLGLPNFRRNWLQPETMVGVLAICKREVSPDIYPGWLSLIAGDLEKDEKELIEFVVQFIEKIRLLKADSSLSQRINRFVENVNSLDNLFTPFDNANSFLKSMNSAGSTVYIVTEGDSRVQRGKFKCLGFQEYVPGRRFITTEDLSRPPQLTEIRALLRIIRVELALEKYQSTSLNSKSLENNVHLYRDLRYALLQVSNLEKLNMLERFYRIINQIELLLSGARLKAHPLFFRYLVRSIWYCPFDPHNGFKMIFSGSPIPQRDIKLATVGDRYDVDLYPIITSIGPSPITVRVRQGKYLNSYNDRELSKLKVSEPDVTVNSLDKVEHYLTDVKVWDNVSNLFPPSLIPESMLYFRKELEICLMFPEKSSIHSVAKSLLQTK